MDKSIGAVLLLALFLTAALVEGRDILAKSEPAQDKQQQHSGGKKTGTAYHPQNFVGGVGGGVYGPSGGVGSGMGFVFPGGPTGLGQPFFTTFPGTGSTSGLPGLPGVGGGIGGGVGGGVIGHGVGQP